MVDNERQMGDNVRTGRADVDPDAPSHVAGINEGNTRGNYEKQAGHLADGRSNAERSTGINPKAHDAIDPSMPKLSPP
ncbi:MAG TPA: hypothetical protein VGQ44_11805 [Gemmatimonadaceae bacterium]|jgi:hypothetical protein|nr:hypothetical protein [Gemmatimonadaceae bacterium]